MLKDKKIKLGLFITLSLIIVSLTAQRLMVSSPEIVEPVEVVAENMVKISSIQASDDITDITYVPEKGVAYVVSLDESKIYTIDPNTATVVGSVEVPYPNRIRVTKDNEYAFVTAEGEKLKKYRVDDFELVGELRLGLRTTKIELDSGRGRAYVLSELSNTVSVVDAETMSLVRVVSVGLTPRDLVLGPSGAYLYVVCEEEAVVTVVSTETLEVVKKISKIGIPYAIGAMPSGNEVFIADRYENLIQVYDEISGTIIKQIPVVKQPSDITFNPKENLLFVAGFATGVIGIVDLNSYEMTNIVSLESGFQATEGLNNIVFVPELGKVIATNTLNGSVWLIE